MSKVDVLRKEAQIADITAAKKNLELRKHERFEEIERIDQNIKIQDDAIGKTMAELETLLAQEK